MIPNNCSMSLGWITFLFTFYYSSYKSSYWRISCVLDVLVSGTKTRWTYIKTVLSQFLMPSIKFNATIKVNFCMEESSFTVSSSTKGERRLKCYIKGTRVHPNCFNQIVLFPLLTVSSAKSDSSMTKFKK